MIAVIRFGGTWSSGAKRSRSAERLHGLLPQDFSWRGCDTERPDTARVLQFPFGTIADELFSCNRRSPPRPGPYVELGPEWRRGIEPLQRLAASSPSCSGLVSVEVVEDDSQTTYEIKPLHTEADYQTPLLRFIAFRSGAGNGRWRPAEPRTP